MGRCGVLRVNEPCRWYDDLQSPPVGYRWVYRTSLYHNVFDLVGGGRVALPTLYLQKLPEVREPKYWEHQRRVDNMIEEMRSSQKPDKWVSSGEPFLKAYPTIDQWCTDCFEKADGKIKPRTPCTLSLTFFSGAVNLTINDKDKDRSCHTTAQTVEDAMRLLDDHLATGSTPWRYWKKR